MTPEQRDALEQELLELCFDCHPNPDALRARIDSDDEVRALYEQVRATAGVLTRAGKSPLPELELTPPSGFWHRGRNRILVAAAAAVMLVSVPLAILGVRTWQRDAIRSDMVQIMVQAPTSVPAGAPFSFTVETRDVAGEPVDCPVTWRLTDGEATLKAGELDGSRTVEVEAALTGATQLEVVASTPRGARRAVVPIDPKPIAPLIHLTTDKPIYRPGEAMRYRAVCLDRLALTPAQLPGAATIELLDPRGSVVHQQSTRLADSAQGVIGGGWVIPDSIAGGQFVLTCRAAEHGVLEQREVTIRRFEPPRLQKAITLDRETYAPGDGGTAEIAVTRMAGGVAEGASVEVSLVVDGDSTGLETTTLDSRGRALVTFEIPGVVEAGAARIVARVTDGGVVETEVEPFVVPTGRVEAHLYPEGGELVAGLSGRVYAELRDPLGRPVSGSGRVVDGEGREVTRFETEHQGRGVFELMPASGESYRLVLTSPSAHSFDLPAVRDEGVALRALDGDGVAFRVASTNDEPITLAAFARGVLVAQAKADSGSRVELPVGDAFGVLRVTAFDAALRPVAERLVHRAPARSIAVALEPDSAIVAPGARQKLRVRTTDESGEPVAAVVGLSVADQALWAMTGEAQTGLLDHASLLSDATLGGELPLDDVATFLSGESARNVDLLLGTQGWRRFVWRGDASDDSRVAAAQAFAGHAAELRQRGSGFGDNDELRSATRAQHDAKRWTGIGLALGLALLLFWGIGESAGWSVRRRTNAVGQVLAGIVAILLVGWLAYGLFRPATLSMMSMAPGADAGAVEPQWLAEGEETLFYIRDFDVEIAQGSSIAVQSALPSLPEQGPEAVYIGMGGEQPGVTLLDLNGFGSVVSGEPESVPPNPALDAFATSKPWPRQYAHRYEPTASRRDFTESIYWNVAVATDASGTATVEFDTSDRVTTWTAHADAHGAGRVGQGTAQFDARLPFHLEATLPIEVTAGDVLRIPVALIADDDSLTEATVAIAVAGSLQYEGEQQTIELDGGRGRAVFEVTVDTGTLGAIRIAAQAGRFRDQVDRQLRIVPRGFPHARSRGGTVTDTTEFTLAMPAQIADAEATLKAFPSPLSTLREGLNGILQEPHGCFEQASSSNYPNLLVLSYLEASGDVVPEVAARARSLLPRGYDLVTGYECDRRGYEWFGKDPAHPALTGYGLLEFQDMAAVYEVNQDMVGRTREWVLGRRDGQGGFEKPDDYHAFGAAPKPVLDAYLTYALLYSGTPASELESELDRIAERAATTGDAYELALCASALGLTDRDVDSARRRLASMQDDDGSLRGSTTSITSSGGEDLTVETTSFAVLAWLGAEDFAAATRKAVEFLRGKQRSSGTFGATQATIMALKALTAYAERERVPPTGGTLEVWVNERLVQRHTFAPNHPDPIAFDLLGGDGRPGLRPGQNTIKIVRRGDDGAELTPLPWACELRYHTDQPADDDDCAVGIETALAETDVREGDTVALTAEVINLTDRQLPMTLAIVGLPASLDAPTDVLDDLRDGGAFDLWGIRGRELIFYWRGLDANETKRVALDLIARVPGTTTAPASRTYLYYTPDLIRWAEPLRADVK